MVNEHIQRLQSRLGYRFVDSHLLTSALIHRSHANERRDGRRQDNERLEFLGDAILGVVVAEAICARFPDASEGELSRIRSEIVNSATLAEVSRVIDLGAALLLGRGEEKTGGRNKESLLADALEAVLGAVFTDGGYPSARKVILSLFEHHIDRAGARKHGFDSKTLLQEFLQGRKSPPPRYELLESSGPDHDRIFIVRVVAEGIASADGVGKSKKEAEQAAARSALDMLQINRNTDREI